MSRLTIRKQDTKFAPIKGCPHGRHLNILDSNSAIKLHVQTSSNILLIFNIPSFHLLEDVRLPYANHSITPFHLLTPKLENTFKTGKDFHIFVSQAPTSNNSSDIVYFIDEKYNKISANGSCALECTNYRGYLIM